MARPKLRIWRLTNKRFNGVIGGVAATFEPESWIYGDNEAAVWFDDDCRYHYISISGHEGDEHSEDVAFLLATGVMPSDRDWKRCPKCGHMKEKP